jgi:hypothetical protein
MSGGNLFVLVVVQLVLTAMPGIAATLLATRFGARDVPILLTIGLVGSGATAMLAFWAYYLDPWLGAPCAYAIFFGAIAIAIWAWPTLAADRALRRALTVPLALWVLASIFLVFFGFFHGGTETALTTAAARFSTQPSQLASDNYIPSFYSDWMFAGHPGSAPIFEPGWHFSDRPPLQTGYILAQRTFGWDLSTLHAELVGVVVQQLWIVGAWALLIAARVSARTRGLAIVAALVSDVTILNGFFVWPKLLAAAFVLAALALVVAPGRSTLRLMPWTAVLIGALAGLAYMAHSSSVFGLIPVALLAVYRGLPNWRWIAAAAAAALVLVLPWSAYQHYGDPPGNRVVKWGLAGVTELDAKSTGEEVVDAYREAGLSGTLENKLQNFLTMAGGGPDSSTEGFPWIRFGSAFSDTGNAVEAVADGHFGKAVSEVRESRFSHLLWTFGLLILALPVIAVGILRGKRPQGADWVFARLCLLVFTVGAVIWGLIMFGNVPGRAIVISGSLALPIVGLLGLVAGVRAVYPRWAQWLVAANAVTVLAIYLPSLEPMPGTSYSAFAAITAAAALAAFLAMALSPRWGGMTSLFGPMPSSHENSRK